MIFVFPRSLVRDACSQKVSKNLKIVCAQVTLTKTGLSAVRTFSPLGVKITNNMVFCSFVFVDVFLEVENWDIKRLRYVPTFKSPNI
jgi:hypothetical protein